MSLIQNVGITEGKGAGGLKATGYFNNQVYEQVWRVISVLISLIFVFMLNKIYVFQTNPIFQSRAKGTIYEISLSVPFACLNAIIRKFVYKSTRSWTESIISQERFPLLTKRQQRAVTLSKWLVDIPFYSLTSIVGFLILRDMPNMPWWLGGSGACQANFTNLGYFDQNYWLIKLFYIIQCSQHLYSFVAHLFDNSNEGKKKFFQTMLHHSLAFLLIVLSYLTNQVLVGIMVLFLHDSSDAFLIMARFYSDYKHKRKHILGLIYALAMGGWIGLRLVAFPLCCISELPYALQMRLRLSAQEQQIITPTGLFMMLMMGGLMVMHLFWTYFIFAAFKSVAVKRKVNINYD